MRWGIILREVAGWLLLLLGLLVFAITLLLLMDRRILEAIPATAIGFVVFRGGIHLLKSALALGALQQWQRQETTTIGRNVSGAAGLAPSLTAAPSQRLWPTRQTITASNSQ
jgi:hypothetical protein